MIVQRYHFNTRNRCKGETVTTYVSELCGLAQFCNFGETLDIMLRDRLVCGISDKATQCPLLIETALTWKKALEIVQGMEMALQNVCEL